jgi:hypothetical protein
MSQELTPADLMPLLQSLGIGQILHFTSQFCTGAAAALAEFQEDLLAAEMRYLAREVEELSCRAQALELTMDVFAVKLP